MILVSALVLLALFSVPLFAGRDRARGSRDLLAPARVAGVFHIVTIVPYLLLVALDESVVKPMVRLNPYVGDLEHAVAWYAFVQACAFVALLCGIRSRAAARLAMPLPVIATRFTRTRYRAAIGCALIVAALGFATFLSQVGGLGYLVMNLERRTAFTAGAGYVLALLNLLFFAIVILIVSMRVKRTPAKWAFAAGLILASAAVFSSLGGRKSTILIFVSVLFAWHYGVRRIRRVRALHLLPVLLIVPYFVLMPVIRSPGGMAYFMSRPGELVSAMGENLTAAVTDLSYVDHYLFVTSYFEPGNVWYGASYLDLLQSVVPSSVNPAKPPMDDGVYVRTLAEGLRAEPGMAFPDLFYSSWPPETLGATFMNFWLPGVLAGMYLLGAIYRLTYTYMLRSGFSLYSILIYAHFVVSFQLSNLRIVQAAIYLTLTTVFFAAFFGLRTPRRRGTKLAARPTARRRVLRAGHAAAAPTPLGALTARAPRLATRG
jgi:hypothetical protein